MTRQEEGPFLLGIDVGTTGCKTELFDENANSKAKAYQDYPITHPEIGWAEENPEEWWEAVVNNTRNVLKASNVNPGQIKGLAISCTNACVPVDKKGNALRNAIMQIDRRTVPQAERIKRNLGEEIFDITGNRVAPGSFSAPIILWIKEKEPRIFEETYKFMVPTGFIVQRLTGKFTVDWSRGATTLLFGIRNKEWSEKLCSKMGIPLEKLPSTSPSWQVVGEVTERAAKITGLKEGTLVIAGCMDTVAAAVGSGALRGGDMFCIIGSVARMCAILDRPFFDKRFLNTCHATPEAWLAIGCVNGAGLSLKWFMNNFGNQEVDLAEKIGVSPFSVLDMEAENSPPGARGIVYLPYIAAERSPIWNPTARGVIFGLNLESERCNVVRAFYEGVAFAIRHNLEVLETVLKREAKNVKVSGGGAKSKLWRQIIADTCEKRMIPTVPFDTEPLGDALIAGVGAGVYRNLEEATSRLLSEEAANPRKEFRERYSQLFALYINLYSHLMRDFKQLSKINF